MTKEQVLERLQEIWAQASNCCGRVLPEVLEEMRNLEKQLEELESNRHNL